MDDEEIKEISQTMANLGTVSSNLVTIYPEVQVFFGNYTFDPRLTFSLKDSRQAKNKPSALG